MITLLLLLAACTSTPTSDDTDPGTQGFVPDMPISGCGLAPYTWQSTETMGEVLHYEYQDASSVTVGLLRGLFASYGATGFNPTYDIQTYRIRYRTQDRGEPIDATALVSFPVVDQPQDFPSLLWVRPTVGFSDDCAPSGGAATDQLASVLLASFGYVVVAPDLIGMRSSGGASPELHPYAVPEPTAIAALDSLRALWRFADGEGQPGIPAHPTHRTVFWGASEGGFGALWADRYAGAYLPEAEILGVIAAVPPTDMSGIAHAAVGSYIDATEGMAAVLTTSHQWYRGTAPLTDLFTDVAPAFAASNVEAALWGSCSDGPDPFGQTSSVADIYQQSIIDAFSTGDWAASEPWSCYLQAGDLRSSPVVRQSTAPVLYPIGELDDLVVGATGRADAPRLCEAGYQLEYIECANDGHVDAAANSLPYQLAWAAARVAGDPVGETCVFPSPVDCATLVP